MVWSNHTCRTSAELIEFVNQEELDLKKCEIIQDTNGNWHLFHED